jgi:hypothetical protein
MILEGFSKEQIENSTGGPKDISMLFSEEELAADFEAMSELLFEQKQRNLNEGIFHQGNAEVIQLVGKK